MRKRLLEFARGDLAAGLTVGVLLVPQGLAYALLSGLPAVFGLNAATLPLLVFAALSSSRHAAFGPFAIISVMARQSVEAFPAPQRHNALLVMTLLSGAMLLLAGLLRAGHLMSLVSSPVLQGFLMASALIIMHSQLPHLLGASSSLLRPHLPTVLLSLGAFAVAAAISAANGRQSRVRLPSSIILVALGVLFGLGVGPAHGIASVGAIPTGLPSFTVPDFALSLLQYRLLLQGAAATALVAFISSATLSQQFADEFGYRVDMNRELLALGAANVVGAFMHSVVSTGGLSRTVVNVQAGAKSQLASVVAATIVSLTLLFLTDEFSLIPTAVLSVIIVTAVSSLIRVQQVVRLYRLSRSEFVSWASAFLLTMFVGIAVGVLGSVLISVLLVAARSARPRIVRLGRLRPGEYRSTERFPMVEVEENLLIFRVDAPLFFGNVAPCFEWIRSQRAKRLIWDWSSVNFIDATFLQSLADLCTEFKANLFLVGVKEPLREQLRQLPALKPIVTSNRLFWSIQEAVDAANKEV